MERVAAWGAQICLRDTLLYNTHTHVTALILCALMQVMGVISTGIIHTSHCEHTHTSLLEAPVHLMAASQNLKSR